jgi:D-alanyl-lipoteichoic acid acyltransferase DltB (MBOAT superfamily)
LIVQTINDLGAGNYSIPDIFLPIGISFYTFQSISYIVDVYSKKIPSSRNFIDYAFYMTFFPHLVAGPIVRAKDFIPQINHPIPFGNEQIRRGFFRILTGLSKKLILADFLARYVDMLHSDPAAYNGAENLLGMVAYSCQIYFDFSGYSDIAIGIAILLGYELKENFNNPYQATSITEFWRRWHISLSTWLRDYIYIPLGGNQKGKYNQYLFLMITMTIGGLWHGANWKFVLWGICHGAALILHKLILRDKEISPDRMNWLSRLLKTIAVFLFVSVLWIFFRAVSFDHALQSLSKIIHNQHWIDYINFWEQREEVILVLTISLLLIFIPVKVKQYLQILFDRIPFWLLFPLLLLGMQLILELKGTEIKPFIYFQF